MTHEYGRFYATNEEDKIVLLKMATEDQRNSRLGELCFYRTIPGMQGPVFYFKVALVLNGEVKWPVDIMFNKVGTLAMDTLDPRDQRVIVISYMPKVEHFGP